MVTELGMGKRTLVNQYRPHGRGTGGQRILNITKKTGIVASMEIVHGDEELMLISASGIVIRTELGTIRRVGPYAQGVAVMNLKPGDRVACIAVLNGRNGDGKEDGASVENRRSRGPKGDGKPGE